jgi:hypothetical protein
MLTALTEQKSNMVNKSDHKRNLPSSKESCPPSLLLTGSHTKSYNMVKGKSQSKSLRQGTDMYKAVEEEVSRLWDAHGESIEKWPEPAILFEEYEGPMTPYGDSHSQRLNKFRALYNRMVKAKFALHGKCNVGFIY